MENLKNDSPYPRMGKIEKFIAGKEKEIPQSIIDAFNKKQKEIDEQDKETINNLLLESVWISRWTDEKRKSLYAVLTPEEAVGIVNEILKNLDEKGFKIVRK